MKKAKEALQWILGILEKHNSLYEISGGLAAITYGSKRELADIDIDIPSDKFREVVEEVKPYIFQGPDWYHDKNWDLFYAKLEYAGQKIDICDGDSFKIVDDKTGEIVIDGIDFSELETREVFGIKVFVMPKEKLIRYKSVLGRDVDKLDIQQIK